jgi:hypothetical protein
LVLDQLVRALEGSSCRKIFGGWREIPAMNPKNGRG